MKNLFLVIITTQLFFQCVSKSIVDNRFIELLMTGDSAELPNLYGSYMLFGKVNDKTFVTIKVDQLKTIFHAKKVKGKFSNYLRGILNQRVFFPSDYITGDLDLFQPDQTIMNSTITELMETFSIEKESDFLFFYYPKSHDTQSTRLSLIYKFYMNHFMISFDDEVGMYRLEKPRSAKSF
jgi:hypothetical protein